MNKHYTANPSEDRESGLWFVWDMYIPLPPRPVYFGTMEEAGLVADALNKHSGTTPDGGKNG